MRGGGARACAALVVSAFVALVGCAPGASRSDPPGASPPGVSPPGASPSGTPGVFQPGAAGLGDRYFPAAGNGGYDVLNYDLKISYEPSAKLLTGRELITARATGDLSRFNLDAHGLRIQTVTIGGATSGFSLDGDELVITPARGIARGTRFQVEIGYRAAPTGYDDDGWGRAGFLPTRDGAIAQGEPWVAASWFPVNDHPRDKATYTIAITVPEELAALSNGVLVGTSPAGTGHTTWRWAEHSPMASYLATIVIGRYRVHRGAHHGLPVLTAVQESLPASVDAQLARTPEIVDFLTDQFGPYPFDAMGGIAHDDTQLTFALENQTRPVYPSTFFAGGRDGSWVIVHELAHQWFGDSVSVANWSDIWLNEGFATYAEWLWQEHVGTRTVQRSVEVYYAAQSWRLKIADPGPDHLFDEAIYDQGALTLHALRLAVGDAHFFTTLKRWAAEHRDGNADTAAFIALAEQVSGRSLTGLFNDWLYHVGRPAYPG